MEIFFEHSYRDSIDESYRNEIATKRPQYSRCWYTQAQSQTNINKTPIHSHTLTRIKIFLCMRWFWLERLSIRFRFVALEFLNTASVHNGSAHLYVVIRIRFAVSVFQWCFVYLICVQLFFCMYTCYHYYSFIIDRIIRNLILIWCHRNKNYEKWKSQRYGTFNS